MPVAALVAAAGLAGIGGGFRGAQVPFVLVAAALPVLTYVLARRWYRDPGKPLQAGLLALFPGLFLPFLLTTDTFGLFALIGGGALALAAAPRPTAAQAVGAGVLVGLGHLSRADGVLLWLPVAYLLLRNRDLQWKLLPSAGLGYAAVLAPWLARNLADLGRLWPAGGGHVLWTLSYDDTFAYPAGLLTPSRWWAAGLGLLVRDRWAALGTNLRSLLIVNGLVFLAPLMAAGAWRRRAEPLVRGGAVYLGVLVVIMSLVFPYAGARGGYFHSSAALMPILFALVPEGLEALVGLGVRLRSWSARRATSMFLTAIVAMAVGLTSWAAWSRWTHDGAGAGWERNARTFADAARLLPSSGITLAANDPPGVYLASGLPTVVLPNGGLEELRRVVERYGVDWVLIEANHPAGLDSLYRQPAANGLLGAPIRFADADGAPAYLFPVQP
jgi:hypothetical protein